MTYDRRSVLGLLAGAAFAGDALAQGEALAAFEPAALTTDLDALSHAWTSLHPGLYRYQAPAQLESRFAALRRWADRPRSLQDFYLKLGRLSAQVCCGHTYPNPANQGRRVSAAIIDPPIYVPFGFTWLGRRMIVTAAAADGPLRRGDEIEALDGVSVRRLHAAFLPLMRADGANDAKRASLLSVLPGDSQALFDVYRSVAFGASGEVRVDRPDQAPVRLPLVTIEQRRAALAPGARERSGWTFAISDGVGVLTMSTWALYNETWDWQSFIDASVDELIAANAPGLIVDLRGNEGGQDVIGAYLIARLIAAPLTPPAFRRRVRYRAVPADLNPMLDTWDDRFRDWGDAARGPAADGFYELGEAEDETIAPRGRRFAGGVAVLIDASNSSATFGFAQLVRDTRLGKLIGSPTGGNLRGINGGAYFFLRLPNSRIEIDLPLIGYFPRTPQPNDGINPHVAIAASQRDIAEGADPVLARARRELT